MNRKYRKTVIAGNWKMNKTPTETKAFMTEFKAIMPKGRWCDVALCVPAAALADDAHCGCCGVDSVVTQVGQLRAAHSGGIEHLKNERVADGCKAVGVIICCADYVVEHRHGL